MLTVADIVGAEALRLTLRGGLAGSGRPVRWVHISELPDPTPWLRGGELLLTTGLPLESEPAAYVERLASAGLTGIGLGLGLGYDEAPAEAVAAADRLGFPLFTIPYEVPFIAITEAVFTRLSDARVAEAVQRLAGDLVEAVLAGEVDPRELRRRARAFGLTGTRPLAFVALPATPEAAPLARLAEAAGRFGPAGIRAGVVALIDSLQAYIEANGRWAEAAAALGVHRHTLRYRIRKVEHLTGRSPADARDRRELEPVQ